jgi:hypothetical protein
MPLPSSYNAVEEILSRILMQLLRSCCRYPGYNFVSDNDISRAAGAVQERYSDESLHGIIFDIQMLSECDYIVCTFSSQVEH